ncbi:hypothetical protein D477_012480 [Arthrobacter crystallopoietes BAB-32]|uniref:Uncharacterized protein n=1 Tax=Arthrobacter crystallopoietes BAB-32 TaxID=1246476 RepID=N1UXW9_9MICC|nr:hypothetical protein [Arthrobacter crystallopoietes]EMY33895.1 hypothetical protein D477_012480 [Arthrobacter crystallopoietes BAB-32]
MTHDTIFFTMTAEAPKGGERIFKGSVFQLFEDGAGGASFHSVEIAGDTAVLRGEIVGDRRLVTENGLAEYLEDILASKEAIHLDIDVRFEAPDLRLQAAA